MHSCDLLTRVKNNETSAIQRYSSSLHVAVLLKAFGQENMTATSGLFAVDVSVVK